MRLISKWQLAVWRRRFSLHSLRVWLIKKLIGDNIAVACNVRIEGTLFIEGKGVTITRNTTITGRGDALVLQMRDYPHGDMIQSFDGQTVRV